MMENGCGATSGHSRLTYSLEIHIKGGKGGGEIIQLLIYPTYNTTT